MSCNWKKTGTIFTAAVFFYHLTFIIIIFLYVYRVTISTCRGLRLGLVDSSSVEVWFVSLKVNLYSVSQNKNTHLRINISWKIFVQFKQNYSSIWKKKVKLNLWYAIYEVRKVWSRDLEQNTFWTNCNNYSFKTYIRKLFIITNYESFIIGSSRWWRELTSSSILW